MCATRHTERSTAMNYIIYDISTIRYRFGAHHTTVSALAPSGELLATVDLAPHHSEREAAFLAADAALRGGRVLHDTQRCRVALYNPYTATVCLDPVPDTKQYSDHEPLIFEAPGTLAELRDGVLYVAERAISQVSPTPSSVTRAILEE
jgi:hypothetical protein